MSNLAEDIRNKAISLGYDNCGIIQISEMHEYGEKLKERMTKVTLGSIAYRNQKKFTEPEKYHPWAKSVIVTLNDNAVYNIPHTLKGLYAKDYLVDGRQDEDSDAWKRRVLFTEHLESINIRYETEPKFGITALRWAAYKAGLGIIRKNNFFYTEKSSYVTIEAFLVDKEMEVIGTTKPKQCLDNCGRCVASCPSKSLCAPYTMSLLDCVSFMTSISVENGMGMPSVKQQEQIGGHLYGCDVCQDVCPYNKDKWLGGKEFPGLDALSDKLFPEAIMSMSYSEMAELLLPKFFYISEKNLWKWKINALTVMGNSREARYKPFIELGLQDANRRVRKFAERVLNAM